MKLQQVENIIKNEILRIKGNNYNYKYISNDILYIALDNVDYDKKQITKDLIIKVIDLYFKREKEEKRKKELINIDNFSFFSTVFMEKGGNFFRVFLKFFVFIFVIFFA